MCLLLPRREQLADDARAAFCLLESIRHALIGRVHGQLELCLRIRRGVELHARRHQLLINLSQEVREYTLSDLGFLTKVLEFAAREHVDRRQRASGDNPKPCLSG